MPWAYSAYSTLQQLRIQWDAHPFSTKPPSAYVWNSGLRPKDRLCAEWQKACSFHLSSQKRLSERFARTTQVRIPPYRFSTAKTWRSGNLGQPATTAKAIVKKQIFEDFTTPIVEGWITYGESWLKPKVSPHLKSMFHNSMLQVLGVVRGNDPHEPRQARQDPAFIVTREGCVCCKLMGFFPSMIYSKC